LFLEKSSKMKKPQTNIISKYIEESIVIKNKILKKSEIINNIKKILEIFKNTFRKRNKILIAGNGGSAADSQHFATELTGRYKIQRKGYAAISLSTDTSFLTAWSNDYNFETVFARQIEALGQKNDIFFGISTSGNSKNIIAAVKTAKTIGLKTICLLGKTGGKLKNLADISIIIPSKNTPRIQECHIMLIHIICEELEKLLKQND